MACIRRQQHVSTPVRPWRVVRYSVPIVPPAAALPPAPSAARRDLGQLLHHMTAQCCSELLRFLTFRDCRDTLAHDHLTCTHSHTARLSRRTGNGSLRGITGGVEREHGKSNGKQLLRHRSSSKHGLLVRGRAEGGLQDGAIDANKASHTGRGGTACGDSCRPAASQESRPKL